jgi:hypothetical protein
MRYPDSAGCTKNEEEPFYLRIRQDELRTGSRVDAVISVLDRDAVQSQPYGGR